MEKEILKELPVHDEIAEALSAERGGILGRNSCCSHCRRIWQLRGGRGNFLRIVNQPANTFKSAGSSTVLG